MKLIDLWNENQTNVLRTIMRGEEIPHHECCVSIHCYI